MGYYTNFTLDCYDNHAYSFDISFGTELGKALTATLHEINPDFLMMILILKLFLMMF